MWIRIVDPVILFLPSHCGPAEKMLCKNMVIPPFVDDTSTRSSRNPPYGTVGGFKRERDLLSQMMETDRYRRSFRSDGRVRRTVTCPLRTL
jgi:hypothetical protein